MKKKLLSLLMVATISLGIIGCGDKGKEKPTEAINENFSGGQDYYLAVLPDNTTKTDATLVTDMREMTITYDGLEIESYKDLEVDEEWENNWKKYIEVIKESMVLKNSAPYSLFIVIIIKKYIML